MNRALSNSSKLAKRIWAAVATLSTLALSVGMVQLHWIDVTLTRDLWQRWGVRLLTTGFTLACVYLGLFELYLPWWRKRNALRELGEQISVQALLTHYRTRPVEISNPVVLSSLRCCVTAHRGPYPKDLTFEWTLEGTNTSAQRLSTLELSIAGNHKIGGLSLSASCRTEFAEGRFVGPPLLAKDRATTKRLRLPFASGGPDTGEFFRCQLEYTWPQLLSEGTDYFFFETSNFGHIVNLLDFHFRIQQGNYDSLYVYQIDLESGRCDFLAAEQFDKVSSTFQSAIKKPSNESVYVFLVK